MRCPSNHPIDPETEQPIGPFKPDPVEQETRDAELDNLKTAWDEAMWAGWSIDDTSRNEVREKE